MIKYTKWADGIELETLTALIRSVGEYGAVACLILLESGVYPMPPTDMDDFRQMRKNCALLGMSMIYAGDVPSADVREDEDDSPAFPGNYQSVLASDKRSLWASELDVDTYETLIWNIGEFSLHSLTALEGKYTIPHFPDYPIYSRYMRSSLYKIVRIFDWCLRTKYRCNNQ